MMIILWYMIILTRYGADRYDADAIRYDADIIDDYN